MLRRGTWIALALIALLLTALLLDRDAAARFVWNKWRSGSLAIALDRSDAPLAMEIGNYYFGSAPVGDAAQPYDPILAARAFKTALRVQPGVLWAHYSLARIDFANGNFGAALDEANAELAANPDNLRTLYVRGLIYGYRNLPPDLSLAETDLSAFTKWAPTEWAGYNDLAWILLREGKYQETLDALSIALQKVPDAKGNP